MDHKKATSIIDQEWEYLDPTPDVHSLFMQFNQRFFSGKLEGVEVKWSTRMTRCAGVCSYEGRGGLCSVRLSAPLLKLRPRKDLVETLLHEMIHAYLFVTKNNKDRDGHGPEFQKHMNRINKECGCHITIYHSFHEEVKLYQRHVWRCNGPCQYRKPFFGLVRRTMNRAPGPNDNWWSQHQATCGGKYTKIQEPEDYKNGKSKILSTDKENKNGDIRKFIFSGRGNPVSGVCSTDETNETKPSSSSSPTVKGGLPGPSFGSSNRGIVRQISSSGRNSITSVGESPGTSGTVRSGRINARGNNGSYKRGGGTRVAKRGGTTLVVTKSSRTTKEDDAQPNNQPSETSKLPAGFVPFQGQGFTLGSKLNKQETLKKTNTTFAGTRKFTSSNDDLSKNPYKKIKPGDESPTAKWHRPVESTSSEEPVTSSASENIILVSDPPVKCPVCNRTMLSSFLNTHLDECLSLMKVEESAPIVISDENEPDDEIKEEDLVPCPLCEAYYSSQSIEAHVNACVNTLVNAQDTENDIEVAVFAPETTVSTPPTVACPVCKQLVKPSLINQHLDMCLSLSLLNEENN